MYGRKSQSVWLMTVKRSLLCLGVLVAVGWLLHAEAWAHKDRGPNDPCRKQLGDSFLHLTLYQPQFDPTTEYCEEVPRQGKTVMVVDTTVGGLRQTPIGLEVLETSASGETRTILTIPAKAYELGVLDTEVPLMEGSVYLVRVMLEMGADRHVQILSFPVSVAAWYRAMVLPALIVVGLLALTAISVLRYYYTSRHEGAISARG
jgi:hypothetical protein